eukprot:Nk52_evm24s273 gene=Nk52_evmTU24s273
MVAAKMLAMGVLGLLGVNLIFAIAGTAADWWEIKTPVWSTDYGLFDDDVDGKTVGEQDRVRCAQAFTIMTIIGLFLLIASFAFASLKPGDALLAGGDNASIAKIALAAFSGILSLFALIAWSVMVEVRNKFDDINLVDAKLTAGFGLFIVVWILQMVATGAIFIVGGKFAEEGGSPSPNAEGSGKPVQTGGDVELPQV